MPLDYHRHSQSSQVLNRELRSAFRPAQMCHVVHHINRESAGDECPLRPHDTGSRDHTSHPGKHSVPVHRARRPLVSRSLEESSGSSGERIGTEERSKNSFRIVQCILRRLEPPETAHLSQWKALPFDVARFEETWISLLEKNRRGNIQRCMECANHRQSQSSLSREDLGDLAATSDKRNKIPLTEALFLHAHLDRFDSIREADGKRTLLVLVDEQRQNFEFAGLDRAGNRTTVHEFFETVKSLLVIFRSADDFDHCF